MHKVSHWILNHSLLLGIGVNSDSIDTVESVRPAKMVKPMPAGSLPHVDPEIVGDLPDLVDDGPDSDDAE